jgi:hypothetical protein
VLLPEAHELGVESLGLVGGVLAEELGRLLRITGTLRLLLHAALVELL